MEKLVHIGLLVGRWFQLRRYFAMFPVVAFVFVLQSTGSILCEQKVSDDAGFPKPSKSSTLFLDFNITCHSIFQ